MKLSIYLCLFLFPILLLAQEEDKGATQRLPDGVQRATHQHYSPEGGKVDRARICPPNWWVGMKHNTVEVMLYDQDIAGLTTKINYPGVRLVSTTRLENPNYLFVTIAISAETKPGTFNIQLTQDRKVIKQYPYSLLARKKDEQRITQLDASDLIYLIMPDRFANGDASNDTFAEMHQKEINREKMFFRHGGDLQGILDRLDYLEALGVTALWLNPVLENDQPYESYHGYAITDHYAVDQRFGDNALFERLTAECQKRGIKMVMDIIHNHVGDQHWFIQDIPSEDWIHQFDTFTKTTYRAPTLMDPNASDYDKKLMSDGWFDQHMPDLNQKNPQLARYLIQNNIWWIEYAGVDAYRIDTYAYPDQDFMATWAKAMQTEYPQVHLFAETWVHGAAVQAQFTEDNFLRGDYNSYTPGVTDFQLYYAINEALQQQQGWTNGAARIYYTLAKDFLYEDPKRNVVFLDNHDLSRFYSVIGENKAKFKSGIAFLMTTRGIPMLYYGTEILLKNFTDPDGKVRQDFPGGWAGDKTDKFVESGRTAEEQAIFTYVKRLANFRKNSKALTEGKLVQFVPENGVYAYFRIAPTETVLVIMNTHDEATTIGLERYREGMGNKLSAKNVMTEETITLKDKLSLGANETLILKF
ncbi:MAG: glycoside hydrolase family 13 protein [Saprospiraceae bacterium]